MRKLHTHYDNLKVARNAPLEVIRAAYRVLAQRHHPDVNSSRDAQRVMQLLNEAWAVLGDERRRAEHDAWIAEQENQTNNPGKHDFSSSQDSSKEEHTYTYSTGSTTWEWEHRKPTPPPPRNKTNVPPQAPSSPAAPTRKGYSQESSRLDRFNSWLANADLKINVVIVVGILLGLVWLIKSTSASVPARPAPVSEPIKTSGWRTPQEEFEARVAARERGTPLPDTPPSNDGQRAAKTYVPLPTNTSQSSTARTISATDATVWSPNGRPWPSRAGYIKIDGVPLRAGGGLSKFTVDNTSGGSNVYVKLCRPSQDKCEGLRHVFIPDGSSFTMTDLAPGTYEIRYRDLSTGAISKSEPMTLRQTEDDQGTRFSVLRLTLYRVIDGNTSFTQLPEERF